MADTSLLTADDAGGARRASARAFPVPRGILGLLLAALALAALARFPVDRALVATLLAFPLAVVAGIDIRHGVIPNRIVLPATGIVLLAQLALFPERTSHWLIAPLVLAAILMAPSMFGRSWLGMGDVKLVLLIGAGLGWAAVGALLLAFMCVFPVALLVVVRGGAAARKKTIPFGPFLALGALIVLFAPHLAGLPGS